MRGGRKHATFAMLAMPLMFLTPFMSAPGSRSTKAAGPSPARLDSAVRALRLLSGGALCAVSVLAAVLPAADERKGDGALVVAAARCLTARAEAWLRTAAEAEPPPPGDGGGAAAAAAG